MHWTDGWVASPWAWAMMLFMILFWGLVLVGIVWLVIRLIKGSGSASTGYESAEELLKKRYVRGEITKDEYDRMKRDIS